MRFDPDFLPLKPEPTQPRVLGVKNILSLTLYTKNRGWNVEKYYRYISKLSLEYSSLRIASRFRIVWIVFFCSKRS